MSERIWDPDYRAAIHLTETERGLELTQDVGDNETTVALDLDGVKKLRLALTRYERKAKA